MEQGVSELSKSISNLLTFNKQMISVQEQFASRVGQLVKDFYDSTYPLGRLVYEMDYKIAKLASDLNGVRLPMEKINAQISILGQSLINASKITVLVK